MTDLQKKLLNLLVLTDELCRKYDVEYYLLGGTLIGALRHNGFIPWDDDADIIMTRDNWENFYRCTKGNLPEGYKISTQYDDVSVAMPINRMTETGTTGFFRYHVSNPEVAGTQIDIFIMDPVPDTPEDRELYAATVTEFNEFTGMHAQYALRNGTATHFRKNWERSQVVGKRQVMEEIAEKAFHYTEEESQLYGQRFGGSPHFWPKEVFGKPQYVPFEDTMLAIPARPGDCLTIGYDDDWKMIPRGGPTLSTHDFVVRSYTTPSTVIMADFERHVNRAEANEIFLKRKFEWERVFSEKFKHEVGVHQFEAAKVELLYKEKLEQVDVRALLQNREFDKLESLFTEYIEEQSDSKLLGSSSLSGWIQYYRRNHPVLIDIGDDAIYVVLCLLVHRQRLALAVKLLRARCKCTRPLTEELVALNEQIEAIRKIISTFGCNEDDECRKLVDQWMAKYPENPFFVKHDLFLKVRQGLGGSEQLAEIKRCLEIVPDDDELMLLLAENMYKGGCLADAMPVYCSLIDRTNNGIVLNSIRKRLEEVVANDPESEEYAGMLVNCRKQCGDPNAMKYIDSEDDDADDFEHEQDAAENNDAADDSEGDREDRLEPEMAGEASDQAAADHMGTEDWKIGSHALNEVQKRRLKLLNEVDEISRENGIQYFLVGKALWQAMKYHRYIDPNGDIVIAMTADNYRRFRVVIDSRNPANRVLESLENNPEFFRVVACYTDTESLDVPLVRYGTIMHAGIHINIEILRTRETSKLTEMRNRMLEKGLESHVKQRNNSRETKISMKVIDAMKSVFGADKASAKIFASLVKDHPSKSDKKYFIRKFNKKRRYYPAELFLSASQIMFEGKLYPTAADPEEYMRRRFKRNWAERAYPMTRYNKYTRIVDTRISAYAYDEYLRSKGIDPIVFQEEWKVLAFKYRPIKRKTKKTQRYWDILTACGERDRLYMIYHGQKEELIQLHESGNYDELRDRMKELIRVTDSFAEKKLGFSFDHDLFDIMIDCLRHDGMEKAANKYVKYNNKFGWNDLVKE